MGVAKISGYPSFFLWHLPFGFYFVVRVQPRQTTKKAKGEIEINKTQNESSTKYSRY
jgi:hypothetical protein